MESIKNLPFKVEWLTHNIQHFHGARKDMKAMLQKYDTNDAIRFSQEEVIKYITDNYPQYIPHIERIKFYMTKEKETDATLHLFILWSSFNVRTREELYSFRETITLATGWYPYLTGQHIDHHRRPNLNLVDEGLKKSMNKSEIEQLDGLGSLLDITNFCIGAGTSILLKTTSYDIVLDSGFKEDKLKTTLLRPNKKKWLFISHSHGDHAGGLRKLMSNREFLIAITPISLELYLNAISGNEDHLPNLPGNLFSRVTPMWYRSLYRFKDGSSIETIPTYHFPGSMGYLFTFGNKETLFFSGDINLEPSYVPWNANRKSKSTESFALRNKLIDYGILEACFVGRSIGEKNSLNSFIEEIKKSISNHRNHLLLTPPNDYGFFLYLHIYNEIISRENGRSEVRIFLDHKLLLQLEIIEWRLKRKHTGSLDDRLITFLKGRKTLAESARVYDFSLNAKDNINQLYNRGIPIVFILDYEKADTLSYISSAAFKAMEKPGLDISRIGKSATQKRDMKLLENRVVTDYSSPEWLLHSLESTLSNFLLKSPHKFSNVILFHNFPNRLRKFIEELKLNGYKGHIEPLN